MKEGKTFKISLLEECISFDAAFEINFHKKFFCHCMELSLDISNWTLFFDSIIEEELYKKLRKYMEILLIAFKTFL